MSEFSKVLGELITSYLVLVTDKLSLAFSALSFHFIIDYQRCYKKEGHSMHTQLKATSSIGGMGTPYEVLCGPYNRHPWTKLG